MSEILSSPVLTSKAVESLVIDEVERAQSEGDGKKAAGLLKEALRGINVTNGDTVSVEYVEEGVMKEPLVSKVLVTDSDVYIFMQRGRESKRISLVDFISRTHVSSIQKSAAIQSYIETRVRIQDEPINGAHLRAQLETLAQRINAEAPETVQLTSQGVREYLETLREEVVFQRYLEEDGRESQTKEILLRGLVDTDTMVRKIAILLCHIFAEITRNNDFITLAEEKAADETANLKTYFVNRRDERSDEKKYVLPGYAAKALADLAAGKTQKHWWQYGVLCALLAENREMAIEALQSTPVTQSPRGKPLPENANRERAVELQALKREKRGSDYVFTREGVPGEFVVSMADIAAFAALGTDKSPASQLDDRDRDRNDRGRDTSRDIETREVLRQLRDMKRLLDEREGERRDLERELQSVRGDMSRMRMLVHDAQRDIRDNFKDIRGDVRDATRQSTSSIERKLRSVDELQRALSEQQRYAQAREQEFVHLHEALAALRTEMKGMRTTFKERVREIDAARPEHGQFRVLPSIGNVGAVVKKVENLEQGVAELEKGIVSSQKSVDHIREAQRSIDAKLEVVEKRSGEHLQAVEKRVVDTIGSRIAGVESAVSAYGAKLGGRSDVSTMYEASLQTVRGVATGAAAASVGLGLAWALGGTLAATGVGLVAAAGVGLVGWLWAKRKKRA